MSDLTGDPQYEPQVSRRVFLKAGALAALMPQGMGVAFAAGTPPQNAIPPAEALKRLMAGNARYAASKLNPRDFSFDRAARAKGQYPIASILSCADSRVAPELAFDQGPGDLFVVRVAGNIVTPALLASLEYSVHYLGVPLVMVLGHTGCGAVGAAITVLETNDVLPGHLPELVREIEPAVKLAKKTQSGDLLENACVENVRRQVTLLKNSPPVVDKSYAAKKIDIVGAIYHVPTGKIALV
jgi:carbonic anhydrase